MKEIVLLLPFIFILQSCSYIKDMPSYIATPWVSKEIQARWQGRNINEIKRYIGYHNTDLRTNWKGEKYYAWQRSYMTSDGYRSCEFRVYVNDDDKIIKMNKKIQGANCNDYDRILNYERRKKQENNR